MWTIINFLQAIFILTWTAFCGLLGIILMLITRRSDWILIFLGNYLWGPVICAVSGVRVELQEGHLVDKKNSAIYVANHNSLFDIVVLAKVLPIAIYFIAKEELRKVPVLGQYMSVMGHIFVDRKNKDKALDSMRTAAEKIKSGKNVISFPEGTRSKNGELQIFRRGSFLIAKDGKIDIVPVGISGAGSVLPSGSFKLRPGKIIIRVGERIKPEEFTNLSVEELASFARTKVSNLID
jgi:1-acyl-sn-glycerol-3-phosphate acyltransferase